jgi:NAD+ synthase
MKNTVDKIVDWMRLQSQKANAKGGVFGVSGGLDSAVILALAKIAWPHECLGLILPCHSIQEDIDDAIMLLQHFDCPYKTIDLSETYDILLAALSRDNQQYQKLAAANIKPRLRMTTWYYFANLMNYLVVGSSNKDEIYLGYSTKYGDGGVDILPLGPLTKTQVREMAAYLKVPRKIINKIPSAGLWEGQTDEAEMGLKYDDIDAYLTGKPVDPGISERIEQRHKATQHKRALPPIPHIE